jgi:hypothetical protein
MANPPEWIPNRESACLLNWTDHLHKEAKRLFLQDGTHASLLFCFCKEPGLISINPVPPNIQHHQLDGAIMNAVSEHNLYGVIFIGETWTYFIKDKKDHTAFQLLDGEMNIADLNNEDKKEALIVRMESSEGDCLTYLDVVSRNGSEIAFKEGKAINEAQKWFQKAPQN